MTYCTKCGKPTNNGLVCEDCIILDSPWLLAMKSKEDDLVEQIEKLKAENAALKERLKKAVELKKPYLEEDHYSGLYMVHYETVVHKIKAYEERAAAEKRLAELQGGKE